MPVDTTMGIENPRLVQLMNNYRHLCIKTPALAFPFSKDVADDFPGKYVVFDHIDHPYACHEIYKYLSSELPRVHCHIH